MSKEQLTAFLEAVKADAGLQEKLKASSDSDAVVAIAKDAGFSISTNDLKNGQSELSGQELESVAGGKVYGKNWGDNLLTNNPGMGACD